MYRVDNGHLKARKENCAVPQHLLLEILMWKYEGANDEDVIVRLRERTVPSGYKYHTWQPGKNFSHSYDNYKYYGQ